MQSHSPWENPHSIFTQRWPGLLEPYLSISTCGVGSAFHVANSDRCQIVQDASLIISLVHFKTRNTDHCLTCSVWLSRRATCFKDVVGEPYIQSSSLRASAIWGFGPFRTPSFRCFGHGRPFWWLPLKSWSYRWHQSPFDQRIFMARTGAKCNGFFWFGTLACSHWRRSTSMIWQVWWSHTTSLRSSTPPGIARTEGGLNWRWLTTPSLQSYACNCNSSWNNLKWLQ